MTTIPTDIPVWSLVTRTCSLTINPINTVAWLLPTILTSQLDNQSHWYPSLTTIPSDIPSWAPFPLAFQHEHHSLWHSNMSTTPSDIPAWAPFPLTFQHEHHSLWHSKMSTIPSDIPTWAPFPLTFQLEHHSLWQAILNTEPTDTLTDCVNYDLLIQVTDSLLWDHSHLNKYHVSVFIAHSSYLFFCQSFCLDNTLSNVVRWICIRGKYLIYLSMVFHLHWL